MKPIVFDPLEVRDNGAEIPSALLSIWCDPAPSNWWPLWWGWSAALAMALEAEEDERHPWQGPKPSGYRVHVMFCARCKPAAPDCPLGERLYADVWEEFGEDKTPTPSKGARDLRMLVEASK